MTKAAWPAETRNAPPRPWKTAACQQDGDYWVEKSKLTQEDASGRGKVLGRDTALDSNHGDLEGNTPSSTSDDLVANPLASRGVGFEEIQKTGTNGRNGGATDEEGLVVAGGRDQSTAEDGAKGDGDDEGQVADTAVGGGGPVDRLEVDGDVVNGEEEGAGKDKGKGAHDGDGAVLDETARDHGLLALVPAGKDPGGNDEDEADDEADDDGRVPGVGLAAVLDGEDVRDGGAHHEDDADGVHLSDLLEKRSLLGDGGAGGLEEEEDDAGGDTSDGKVDVEAPSPRDVVGEGAAQERTDDAGDTIGGTDDAGKGRSLLGRGREGDDGVGTRAQTSGTDTSNGTAGDEGFSVGGGTADDGAELEDEDGDEKGSLEGEVLVDFAPFLELAIGLRGCQGQRLTS